MSFEKLDKLGRALEALEHAIAILSVDEATVMPEGGGEKRAEAVATIAALHHEQASAPQVGEWLTEAALAHPEGEKSTAVAEMARHYKNLTCLPSEFVRTRTKATMRTEQLWRSLRPSGDWETFRPALENIVALARDEAAMRADALVLAPYDALMEQYDPGNRVAEISPLFDDLKTFLADFLPKALDHQATRQGARPLPSLDDNYSIADQRALGLEIMKALGFDFDHGRLDISHHPFCGGVPADVRITTRYDTANFLSSLMGTMHETGHALYEQGLPAKWAHWPSGRARGMGVHESQSLIVEQQMARTPQFWHWALPLARQKLNNPVLDGLEPADILAIVNHIEPGFIRVDADQVTYPLHVILRYEIELDLIGGAMEVRHIPQAWNEKMNRYLGLDTTGNFTDGPMQDVHWASGAIGYFPSYTLGSMMAAQQFAAMGRDLPDLNERISVGDFSTLNEWRASKIWNHGAAVSTNELMNGATGATLDAEVFKRHLTERYLS